MSILARPSWSPYAAGAGIGILSWFAFWSADHPLGVSSVMVRVVAAIEQAAAPAHVAATPYLSKLAPFFDWEFALVLGLAAGAWLSARLSHSAKDSPVSSTRRWQAILGGFLLLFGARLAGGCTSGHGISGSLQLALSGWIFFACIFASGMLTAQILKSREL